jgi:hypothetical protein
LTKLGIDMSDAETAQVKHSPKVPGTVPANTNDLTQPKLTPIQVPGVTPAPQPGTPRQTPDQAQPPQPPQR